MNLHDIKRFEGIPRVILKAEGVLVAEKELIGVGSGSWVSWVGIGRESIFFYKCVGRRWLWVNNFDPLPTLIIIHRIN